MNYRLIPLRLIPYRARAAEAKARRASYTTVTEIVVAPGCHGGPSDRPPVLGYVVTRGAAVALAARVVRMPDGSGHCDMAVGSVYEVRV